MSILIYVALGLMLLGAGSTFLKGIPKVISASLFSAGTTIASFLGILALIKVVGLLKVGILLLGCIVSGTLALMGLTRDRMPLVVANETLNPKTVEPLE